MDDSKPDYHDRQQQRQSESESKSESSQSEGVGGRTTTTRIGNGNGSPSLIGKHRMSALISQLDQQIQLIQEELDQLEMLGQSSTVCQELISRVESSADALLPVTKGPADVGWDRWFQGANSSRNRKHWI